MVETLLIDDGDPVGSPVDRVRYQLDNHLGSACLELDAAALVISYEEYHPYGTTSYRASPSGTEVSAKRYRYNGKERDEETGLYDYGARYYAAWLGGWTTADPLGVQAGLNVYQYCRGSPINYTDPDGREPRSPADIARQGAQGAGPEAELLQARRGAGTAAWSATLKALDNMLAVAEAQQALESVGSAPPLVDSRPGLEAEGRPGSGQALSQFDGVAASPEQVQAAVDYARKGGEVGAQLEAIAGIRRPVGNTELAPLAAPFARGSALLAGVARVMAAGDIVEGVGNGDVLQALGGGLGLVASLLPGTPKASLKAGGSVPRSGNVWSMPPLARGVAVENALGRNLPGNFPVIDRFVDGVATSIKSLDLGAKSYQSVSTLTRTVTGYIDDVARFSGRRWGGANVPGSEIRSRTLELAVPAGGGSATQQAALDGAIRYGRSVGVNVTIIPF